MIKRISTGFILLFVIGLILGACNSNTTEAGKTDEKTEVVATVNGEEISRKEFDKQFEAMMAAYEQQGMALEDLDEKTKKEIEKTVIDQLINTEIIFQAAQKNKITVEQSEIDSEIDLVKSHFEDEKKFEEALKKNKLNEEDLKEQIKDQLMITKYIDSTVGEITVSEEEMQAAYDQYKEQMASLKQDPEDFDSVKSQLEQQAVAQKKNEKANALIQELRDKNKSNIEVFI